LDKVLIDQLLAEKKRKDFNDEDVDIQIPLSSSLILKPQKIIPE